MKQFRLLALALIVLLAGSLAAQDAPAPALVISALDSSDFPTVTAQVRAFDAEGYPVDNLEGFSIQENGQPIDDFSMAFSDVRPIELVFVIDLNRYSGTLHLRADELRALLLDWADVMRDGLDATTLLVSGGAAYEGPFTLLLESSSSVDALWQVAQQLDPQNGKGYNSLEALSVVLDRIEADETASERQIQIVYVSRVVDNIASSAAAAQAGQIAERARSLNVPIYSLHTDFYGDYSEPLQTLAAVSGGPYWQYTGRQDLDELNDQIFNLLATPGQAYVLSYRSPQQAEGPRTLTISLDDGEPVSADYEVTLSPPQVALITPEADFAWQYTASSQPDAPAPDPLQLAFAIVWPDGFARELVTAELLVDDMPVYSFDAAALAVEGVRTLDDEGAEVYTLALDPASLDDNAAGRRLALRVTDELGISATSSDVSGAVEIVVDPQDPAISIISPDNNSTVERAAMLSAAGDVSGYNLDVVPLTVGITWPGTVPGDVTAAELLVDGAVVASVAFPPVTSAPDDRSSNASNAQSLMTLNWDVSGFMDEGANLRDLQVRMRTADNRLITSEAITLNVAVVASSQLGPQVAIVSPQLNQTLTRVGLPRPGDQLEFPTGDEQLVVASVQWPDGALSPLAVAELLWNGMPLGTQSYPSLMTADALGISEATEGTRFFRMSFDLGMFRTPGPNLGQLAVRVRDEAGYDVTSSPVPVNVQVEIVSPPQVRIVTPANNSTLSRDGAFSEDDGAIRYTPDETLVEAQVLWSQALPFALSGVDLLANGSLVSSLPPLSVAQALEGLIELEDGRWALALQIPWDMAAIVSEGANLYQLQVRVQGESGLMSTSEPVSVNVQVAAPPAQPPVVTITSPQAGADMLLEGTAIPVTAEVLWPDDMPRELQLVELSVDGIAQQSLVFPQGTRFTLNWSSEDTLTSGDHLLSVRLRDMSGQEVTSAPVSVSLAMPVVPDFSFDLSGEGTRSSVVTPEPAATCPDNLLQGWGDMACLQDRAGQYLPWLLVVVLAIALVVVILMQPRPQPSADQPTLHISSPASEALPAQAAPEPKEPPTPPVAPVRSTAAKRGRSVDMMDSILSGIEEEIDRPFRPDINPRPGKGQPPEES